MSTETPQPTSQEREEQIRRLVRAYEQQLRQSLPSGPQTLEQIERHVLHAFNERGLAALQERSHRPLTNQPVLTAGKREPLHTILHHCPRTYGKNRSTWTLKLLAEVACEQGLSEQTLSDPTLLDAVRRLGVSWKRAKHWISSPDPAYTRKKPSRSDSPPARQVPGVATCFPRRSVVEASGAA